MEVVQIGMTGRPHGIRGELTVFVDEGYEDDLAMARALLIGEPPVPYFVEKLRQGGKVTVKLENFNTREAVALLANKPLCLPADRVTEVTNEDTPWDDLIGYRIEAEGYPLLGPIEDIMDLPDHYLAEITYEHKIVYIPLHEDLVVGVREEDAILVMQLPEGLLELD